MCIRDRWQEQHYLCDPHTAVAWSAAEQVRLEDGAPVMVLSTASPYKFPAAVLGALEGGCDGDEFAMMERLHRLTGTEVPRNLAGLQGRPVRHRDVIDKEQMLDYVLAEVMSCLLYTSTQEQLTRRSGRCMILRPSFCIFISSEV